MLAFLTGYLGALPLSASTALFDCAYDCACDQVHVQPSSLHSHSLCATTCRHAEALHRKSASTIATRHYSRLRAHHSATTAQSCSSVSRQCSAQRMHQRTHTHTHCSTRKFDAIPRTPYVLVHARLRVTPCATQCPQQVQ